MSMSDMSMSDDVAILLRNTARVLREHNTRMYRTHGANTPFDITLAELSRDSCYIDKMFAVAANLFSYNFNGSGY